MSMIITFNPDLVAYSPTHEIGVCTVVVPDERVLAYVEALTMLGHEPTVAPA